jgi:rhamnose utilization protein RhaD (predicted bifunctional aldolase and dehydrogenase)
MDDFLQLCRAFGQLEELVQAGGGNISVKISDELSIIKSSGISLADVRRDYGYTIINHKQVTSSLIGKEPNIMDFVVVGPKPSLETYFHSFMKKYVVHLHPTVMNTYLCSKQPGMVPYYKPGFILSQQVQSYYNGQPVLYLQNHGVIFTTDTMKEMYDLIHETYESFRRPGYVSLRQYWKLQEEWKDMYIYKVSKAETLAYLPILRKYNIKNLTPDIALFLYSVVMIEEDLIFIRGPTKRKCLDILEVLRCYCESVEDTTTVLTELQTAEVLNWPDEKYRKNL